MSTTLGEISASVPAETALALIEIVGGERGTTFPQPGKYRFPDGFETWALDEALNYALRVMPDIVPDLYGR